MSTLEVNTINPQSGTTITIGSSGDTVTLGSGATQSGFGGENTPSFMAYLGSNQTCNVGTRTKMQLTQEIVDTNNAFDNSTNYRFTVPSGEGGYYYISFGAGRAGWASNRFQVTVSKNGSDFLFAESYSNVNDYTTANGSGIINLSASDYLELFVWHNGPASPSVRGSTTEVFTYLGGSKLIGA